MTDRPTVVWQLTRACDAGCALCPQEEPAAKPAELTTFEAYRLVDQIVKLSPSRFVISGGDPLLRDDVYQLVDYARRRGLQSAVVLTPSATVTSEAISRLRRNGLSRVVVGLDDMVATRHDAMQHLSGAYRAALKRIEAAHASGIDVEVNTIVTTANVDRLVEIHDPLERLGVVAWNLYVFVPVRGHSTDAVLNAEQEQRLAATVAELRKRSNMEIRVIDPLAEVVFITADGIVRRHELLPLDEGDVRRESLASIYNRGSHTRTQL
jgi:MoaA/NifB/PqqE/SkfB family radical SAM enzyme